MSVQSGFCAILRCCTREEGSHAGADIELEIDDVEVSKQDTKDESKARSKPTKTTPDIPIGDVSSVKSVHETPQSPYPPPPPPPEPIEFFTTPSPIEHVEVSSAAESAETPLKAQPAPAPPAATPHTDAAEVHRTKPVLETDSTPSRPPRSDSLEIQLALMRLQDLSAEVNSYAEDELLLRAWSTADSCLKAAARCAERVEAYYPHDKTRVKPFHDIAKSLTSSANYQLVSTKIRILMDVFSSFNLNQRFDFEGMFPERGLSFLGRRKPAESDVGGSASFSENTEKRHKFFFSRKTSAIKSRDSHASPAVSPRRGTRFGFRRHKDAPPASSPSAAGWTEEAQRGMELSHKVASNGGLNVRIRTKLRIPLFQVLAILYETDFYDKWVPYCKTCRRIGQLSKASMILQQLCDYPWPIKQKENISYCFGVDALDEFGCIIITSHGISDEVTSFLGCPIPPASKKIPRVPSSSFLFILSPVAAGTATVVELFANVDLGVTHLRSVILPILKIIVLRSVRGFFHKIATLATNFESSGYAAKVKESPDVYGWLRNRIDTGVNQNRFRRGSSVATLLLDDLH